MYYKQITDLLYIIQPNCFSESQWLLLSQQNQNIKGKYIGFSSVAVEKIVVH